MNHVRAIVQLGQPARWAIALLVFALSCITACRDDQPVEASPPSRRFRLSAGDTFRYDSWRTNIWGYTIESTYAQRFWRVLSVDAAGDRDSLVIFDSSYTPSRGTTAADTILLRTGAGGTIEYFGFLSDLAARRQLAIIPPEWNTLAWFGRVRWRTGVLDSAGRIEVYGGFGETEDYMDVTINGSSRIFPSSRISLTATTLDYLLWISTDPPCFPRWEEYADPFHGIDNGSFMILRDASYLH